MRRDLRIVLLTFGIVAGFGSALAHAHSHQLARRAAFERHFADVCLDAARSRPASMP